MPFLGVLNTDTQYKLIKPRRNTISQYNAVHANGICYRNFESECNSPLVCLNMEKVRIKSCLSS